MPYYQNLVNGGTNGATYILGKSYEFSQERRMNK